MLSKNICESGNEWKWAAKKCHQHGPYLTPTKSNSASPRRADSEMASCRWLWTSTLQPLGHEESPPWHFEASNIFKQSSRRWILRLHLADQHQKKAYSAPQGSLVCKVIHRMGWYVKIFDLCNTPSRPFLEEKIGKWRNRGSQLHLLTPVSVSQHLHFHFRMLRRNTSE